MASQAALGQPLAFEVRVTLADGEVLADTCVAATVQAGDSRVEASQVHASVQPLREGEAVVRVRTAQALVEPVVTLDLALGCPARVSRQFVLLLDPPLLDETPVAAAPAPPALPAPAPQAAGAPAPAAVAPRRRSATRPAQARAPTAQARPPAAAPAEKAERPAGPRLSLDAPSAPVVAAINLPAVNLPAAESPAETPSPASVATEAAGEVAAAAARAADDRIRHLGEELARMRRENAEMQNTLATLHARVRAADAARDARWIWALGLLSAALLIAVVWLLRRQAQTREQMSEWHEGRMSHLESRARPIDSELEYGESTAGAALPMQPLPPRPPPSPNSLDSPAVPAARTPVSAPPAAPSEPAAETASVSRAERRALAVEELIDLEQQADFFLVLGQDEAAIDLLMTHVRSSGGESPMPYLKLLEIYRRRNDAQAYGRIRERFNRRFNAYAPGWVDEARPSTRALEDYPRVIERLQQVWSEPWQSLDLLDNLLFRPDSTDVSFDLPAYADLLFLYAVAGTLAESGGPVSRVDLLLPLDGEMCADEIPAIERTTPHLPNPEHMQASLGLSLDLDLNASAPKAPDESK